MKVAIVEDDKGIIDAIGVAFEFRWPEARLVSARTGKNGVALVKKERPDIVILDLNLPDMTGFDVLKEIRASSAVPVIILTVRSDDGDVLKGLESGADDYIIKPFNYLTLLARVKAVLRRSESVPLNETRDTTITPRLKIDFISQKVTLDDRPVRLTPAEYRLLVLLARNKSHVVTPQRIAEELWESSPEGQADNIRIHIRRLRRQLGDSPAHMILNVRGSGYLFKG